MYDIARGVKSRVTFGATRDIAPSISPDGTKLAYAVVDPRRNELRLRDLATGVERTLYTHTQAAASPAWSFDGRTITFTRQDQNTRLDVWTLDLATGKAAPYTGTTATETQGHISPDGRWMAYQSNETGRFEIYLAPIPPTGAKWQVSAAGGVVPHWRRDGKELFYVNAELKLLAVPITLGATPLIGAPQMLFAMRPAITTPVVYDQTDDGQRFIINARTGEDLPPQPMTIVQHFDNELRAATGRR
jgi:dipeptidyl aminopeptidase/acylaminoacyl peptidase